ncbi:hypothetical protein N5D61_06680 [Pseudomonas sp. GD03842]|uniref:hypothetical protein n=1 Tax=Pseudomonas sp. GD03842 TaxID=2975385 RepID=UPI00244BE012|nr:hypothetical protein [Pseudomonas sp. GD03842]MDH0746028.1 hypothetical protein [Pseudomonas sp. GD03842]
MMSNASVDKPSILSFNISTAIVWTAISLIVVETFSGALRFYLDKAGLSAVLYGPKILCCLLLMLQLLHLKTSKGVWLGLLALVISSLIAMLHGASLSNIGFSVFGICPILFGMICSEQLIHRKKLLLWAVGLCLLASFVGLALDKLTSVPWKGYSYTLGETELSGNTAWAVDEADRLAGFARVSNILSINLAMGALFVMPFLRSRLLMLVLSGVTAVAIVMTTSKAPAAGFVCAVGLLMVLRFHWTARVVMTIAVLIGMILPLISFLYDFNAGLASTGTLSSLYDRLINSWPNMARWIISEGWELTGAGLGAYGSTLALFPIPGLPTLGSDSTVLYLWGMLGAFGILLFTLQIPLFIALGDDVTRAGRALLAVCFCCLLTGWTTDMPEIATANLFLGMAIGHVLGRNRVPRPVTSTFSGTHALFPVLPHLN